jgi:hypothetical protein
MTKDDEGSGEAVGCYENGDLVWDVSYLRGSL